MMYAMGAEFVEVRVHTLTREIRVPRIVGAFAAGHLMNTRTTHSQLMGDRRCTRQPRLTCASPAM